MHSRVKNLRVTFVCERRGNEPLSRPRPKYESKIKMDLRELGWRVMNGSFG